LISHEFIVDEILDEVLRVKELQIACDENVAQFTLTINPNMNCNFKCWYCYENHIKGSILQDDIIKRIFKFIDILIKRPKLEELNLSFFGGEPLLYFNKNVVPIIDYCVTKCNEKNINLNIGFTTNGYLADENFISYFVRKNLRCGLQITLDGYGEQHDEVRNVNANKGSYSRIVENIKQLAKNNFGIRLRVNYTDKNIDGCCNIVNDFIDQDIDLYRRNMMIDFHRVWQNHNGANIDEKLNKVISLFDAAKFMTNSKYSANNVLEPCYADKRNSVVVNYNGDIYKCTARDFSYQNREGFIDSDGILIWENDSLERRMNAKFNNKPCLTCKIMPLCNGGCSQHALENLGIDYCIYNGDEAEKDKIIFQHVVNIYNTNVLNDD
jgi:uncharacterized protein